ncbi:MAG TPA: hemolysin family protein [Mycobacteriales bacterium]|nr:hemolysin family protein [Mycobacteriales bacterium]
MGGPLLYVLLVVGFVLLGGTFAAAEIALVSLRESQVKALSERGRRGRRLAKLAADPNRFLAAVQVGVTLAGFFSAAFGATTLARPVSDWLVRRGVRDGVADPLAFVLVTGAISYLALVLGELAPKRIGLQRAERVALFAAAPLDRIATTFRPLIWLLSRTTNGVVRLLGADPAANRESITDEELRGLVAAHESLSGDERKLIDEVFGVGERHVREVMLPRTEVEFLDATMTVSRAAKLVLDSPHSRYPVVGQDVDDVVGFVHIRDLLAPDVPGGRAATVGSLARPVRRLPGSKKVLPALSEMRREGHHLAIVVDEYGGTDGIVTLEDLIEELVGDIRDEYDRPGRGPAQPGGVLDVDGLLNLDDFAEQTGLQLPDGPYETAAGYVMAALGALPALGDTVRLDGWTLIVTELDGRRIARLRVTPPEPPGRTGEPATGPEAAGPAFGPAAAGPAVAGPAAVAEPVPAAGPVPARVSAAERGRTDR